MSSPKLPKLPKTTVKLYHIGSAKFSSMVKQIPPAVCWPDFLMHQYLWFSGAAMQQKHWRISPMVWFAGSPDTLMQNLLRKRFHLWSFQRMQESRPSKIHNQIRLERARPATQPQTERKLSIASNGKKGRIPKRCRPNRQARPLHKIQIQWQRRSNGSKRWCRQASYMEWEILINKYTIISSLWQKTWIWSFW